jgi:hypothetical protein
MERFLKVSTGCLAHVAKGSPPVPLIPAQQVPMEPASFLLKVILAMQKLLLVEIKVAR